MDELRLFKVLSDFSRSLAAGMPVQRILDHLVERALDVLPVSAAGATLISEGAVPSHVAATDAAAMRFERLQTETYEGPGLLAFETGDRVSVPDLAADGRFPRFGAAAATAGLAAVHAFPLRHFDGPVGALALYSDRPDRLDARSMDAAQMLADVSVAHLVNAGDGLRTWGSSRHNHLHDPLLGLPNREFLRQRLERVARRGGYARGNTAILFVNLDHFNKVNHIHGHQLGDALLRAVAQRLAGIVRIGDTLARFSGDEFVFLCEDMHGETHVDQLAERVHNALHKPFVLGGAEVRISASVGVAIAGPDDDVSDRLVITADTAMRQAKRKGGGRHQFVDRREALQTSNRHTLEADVRLAFAGEKFDVAYQPIVRCADGLITGVEALLRWSDPARGNVPPEAIVSVAEQSGLIDTIGAWVLERACHDRCEWLREYPTVPLDLAVNVSARQLMAPNFSAVVAGILSRTAIEPTALVLEMTEHILIEDIQRAMVVLAELKELGIRLALDDFGTGYSSLSYLRRLPIDIVKVDQSFISDIGTSQNGSVIVAAVTHLAHEFGLTVTAEGVETQSQRDEVTNIGCDEAQGYFYSRPMPAAAIRTQLVEVRGGRPSSVRRLRALPAS